VATVYAIVRYHGPSSCSSRSAGCRANQCSLILGHPRAARQKKSKRADRQVLVFLHRSLPQNHKFSPKVVQAVFLVKEKMGIFRHIFPWCPDRLWSKKKQENRYLTCISS
jgi:hypothetical protein